MDGISGLIMHSLRVFVVFLFLGCACLTVQAANMALNLMDSHDYYQVSPRQGPLAEQFTTIINSPPSPVRITQKNAVRIALFLFGDEGSIENKALQITLRKRMRELGIDYRLDVYLGRTHSETDFSAYLKVAATPPDYIVMTKLGFVQRRFLERFLRTAKTKVILYDFASPLIHWMNNSPLMYIGFDQQRATTGLASYLDRQLPPETTISALVLPTGYLGHARCDLFLDEMLKYNRHVSRIRVVADDKKEAFEAAREFLKETPTDFIFSCSQNISEGVVAALEQSVPDSKAQTNAWGLSPNGIADLVNRNVKVNVLFMKDNLSIAVAEAIKLDLEGKNMPTLYVANSTLMPAELDSESLRLMVQQAYQYSVELWQQ